MIDILMASISQIDVHSAFQGLTNETNRTNAIITYGNGGKSVKEYNRGTGTSPRTTRPSKDAF